MAVIPRDIIANDVNWGPVFFFEKKGDVFPVHSHPDEASLHLTLVLYGSVKLLGHPRHDGKVVSAKPGGTILKWVPGELHGFEAEEDGATIFNAAYTRKPWPPADEK